MLEHDPENLRAISGLIQAFAAAGQVEEAQHVISDLPDKIKKASDVHAAIASLELMTESQDAGEEATLVTEIDANPDNHQARYDLAMARFASNNREGAVDALIGEHSPGPRLGRTKGPHPTGQVL